MHKLSTISTSRALQEALARLPRPQITAAECNAWLATLPPVEPA
jgi:hypothetical protein